MAFAFSCALLLIYSSISFVWVSHVYPDAFSLDQSAIAILSLFLYLREGWKKAFLSPVIVVGLRLILTLLGTEELLVPLLYLAFLAIIAVQVEKFGGAPPQEREA